MDYNIGYYRFKFKGSSLYFNNFFKLSWWFMRKESNILLRKLTSTTFLKGPNVAAPFAFLIATVPFVQTPTQFSSSRTAVLKIHCLIEYIFTFDKVFSKVDKKAVFIHMLFRIQYVYFFRSRMFSC